MHFSAAVLSGLAFAASLAQAAPVAAPDPSIVWYRADPSSSASSSPSTINWVKADSTSTTATPSTTTRAARVPFQDRTTTSSSAASSVPTFTGAVYAASQPRTQVASIPAPWMAGGWMYFRTPPVEEMYPKVACPDPTGELRALDKADAYALLSPDFANAHGGLSSFCGKNITVTVPSNSSLTANVVITGACKQGYCNGKSIALPIGGTSGRIVNAAGDKQWSFPGVVL
ncbi:hypothetical protein JCM10207_000118 [Rhodosporidiobolus poonsookiae]